MKEWEKLTLVEATYHVIIVVIIQSLQFGDWQKPLELLAQLLHVNFQWKWNWHWS